MKTRTLTINYQILDANALSPEDLALRDAAQQATSLAYAPYSEFRVGAAASLQNGKLIQAANLENAAYPQCLCAEATLLGSLHTQHPGEEITAVAVAVDAPEKRTEVAAPCGSCRQQLHEAEARQRKAIRLMLVAADGSVYMFDSVRDLLPFGFSL